MRHRGGRGEHEPSSSGDLAVAWHRPACGVLVRCSASSVSWWHAARRQEPASPQNVAAAQLQAAIDKLGSLDYDTRTDASRLVRRTRRRQAVPALLNAVAQHADGYVRYRALVLLTGFNDPRTKDAMRESLSSPNDRLRTVAYSYFEHNPDTALLPRRCWRRSRRSRPSSCVPRSIRALAAHGDDLARAAGAGARGRSRRGLLPQRGHRGARRLQGGVRVRRR